MEKKLKLSGVLSHSSAIILIAMLCVCSFFVTGFISQASISQLVLEISMYGMVAVGLSLVMMGGGIDLSVGYLMCTVAVVTIAVGDATGSIWAAVVVSIAAGAAMGAVNGFFVTKVGINPLIATIALNYIYNGIVLRSTNQSSFRASTETIKSIANLDLFGVPGLRITIVLFVLFLVIIGVFLRSTNTGNSIYVTGGNADAGKLSGINPKKYLFLCYLMCGVCCAIAGIFLASRNNVVSYTLGAGKDVFAISACVIGGIGMTGGSGTMSKVLIGVAIMRIIATAMNLLYVPSAWTNLVSGVLLLVILIIDKATKGSSALKY